MARAHCEQALEAKNSGIGATLGATGRSHLRGWLARSVQPVPRGWLAPAVPRVLQACGSSHSSEPLLLFLYRSSGRFAESDNHFRQSFYHPVLQGVYNTSRQRTCLSAFADMLNFSSREGPASRGHETCQIDNKK